MFRNHAILLTAFLLIVASTPSEAQAFHPFNPYSIAENSFLSVETFSMSKYGVVSPALYTGAMSYSVPIYTYQDPDFTIPISLEYSFDGFKPSTNSGTVGMGWFLNCGGVITRDIIGLPDEEYDIRNTNKRGYFHYLTEEDTDKYNSLMSSPISPCFQTDSEILEPLLFQTSPVYVMPTSLSFIGDNPPAVYDSDSDLYHFNFMGYHGDFVLTKGETAGTVKTIVFNSNIPQGEIKIEANVPRAQVAFFTFTITTPDGYKYSFGAASYENSYNIGLADGVSSTFSPPSAFKLYEIKAPNGRSVYFEGYKYKDLPGHAFRQELSYLFSPISEMIMTNGGMNLYGHIRNENTPEVFAIVSMLPGKVIIDQKDIICFNYSEREKSEFEAEYCQKALHRQTSFQLGDGKSVRLSSVNVYNNKGETIETVTFTHTYSLACSEEGRKAAPRMFLESVNSARTGKTRFSYNLEGEAASLPPFDTEEVDHWGYFKKGGGGFPLYDYSQQDNDLYNYGNGERTPDFGCTMYGALTRIDYPTGGCSEIEYEPNDAGMLIDRTISQGVYLKENNIKFKIGGVRVRKIKNSSKIENGVNDYVEYRYENRTNRKSSGILLNMRRYALVLPFRYNISGRENSGSLVLFGNDSRFLFMRDSHIGYSYVQEYHPDGSFVEHQFSDFSMFADWFGADFSIFKTAEVKHLFYDLRMQISLFPGSGNQISLFYPQCRDMGCLRGKEISTKAFDKDGRLFSESYNSYSFRTDAVLTQYADLVTSIVQYPYHCITPYLESTASHNYYYDQESNPSGEISNSTLYEYNSRGQKKAETHTSGGDSVNILYRFISDCNTSSPSGYSNLISDIYKVVESPEGKWLIAAEHYEYEDKNNPHPTKVIEYVIDNPILIGQGNSPEVYLKGWEKTDKFYFKYDKTFRLREAQFPGGAYIKYSWTTDGKYIASKSVNADDNMIKYEWKDMIGLSKMQDAAGRTETYQYDTRNRLRQRTDTNGNPTEKYNYHLINE